MMVNLYSIPRYNSVVRRLWLSFPAFQKAFQAFSNTRFLKKESSDDVQRRTYILINRIEVMGFNL